MSINGSTCKIAATLPPTHGEPCRNDVFRRPARRVVLAGRFNLGTKVADQFRKLGWEVISVTSAHDVHAAAADNDPHAILLSEHAGEESGYLAAVKLRHTQPELRVVVVGSERTSKRERFAEFVGATFATEADGVTGLVNAAV